MNKGRTPVYAVFVILASFVSMSAQSLDDRVALADKSINIHFNKEPLYKVFGYLMNEYDAVIGFEQSPLDYDHRDFAFQVNLPYEDKLRPSPDGSTGSDSLGTPEVEGHFISVNYQNTRLEVVMNDIVRQLKNYKWKIEDNVVQIVPVGRRDPKVEQLMQVNFKKFTIQANQQIINIKYDLIHSPEITAFLQKNDLTISRFTWASYYNRRLQKEITFSNLTLRELLNEIAKVKRGGWFVGQSRNGEDFDIAL